MNKQINYILEYLAKKDDYIYKEILGFFEKKLIYIPTKFSPNQLELLAQKSDIDLSKTKLDKLVNEILDDELIKAKKSIFHTLIKSNFKKDIEKFNKVESSIYKLLDLYINSLCIGFDLFYIYTKSNLQEPEICIEFANVLHVKLLNKIFNKEEIVLLEKNLKEVMSVYLALYAKYLYK
ncbi:hypothetical protein ACKGJI_05030 [Sulfurospirillum sp. 1307]